MPLQRQKQSQKAWAVLSVVAISWQGKSTSEFIRKNDVEPTKRFMSNYKRFIDLKDDWIGLQYSTGKTKKIN